MRTRAEETIFRAGVTLLALIATPVGCPAMKGLVRAQPMWGRVCIRCGPTIFLDCLVTNPDNEPELSLREAASFLLALIVFLALMSWMAMQWM
jgi:hypothetical protein